MKIIILLVLLNLVIPSKSEVKNSSIFPETTLTRTKRQCCNSFSSSCCPSIMPIPLPPPCVRQCQSACVMICRTPSCFNNCQNNCPHSCAQPPPSCTPTCINQCQSRCVTPACAQGCSYNCGCPAPPVTLPPVIIRPTQPPIRCVPECQQRCSNVCTTFTCAQSCQNNCATSCRSGCNGSSGCSFTQSPQINNCRSCQNNCISTCTQPYPICQNTCSNACASACLPVARSTEMMDEMFFDNRATEFPAFNDYGGYHANTGRPAALAFQDIQYAAINAVRFSSILSKIIVIVLLCVL